MAASLPILVSSLPCEDVMNSGVRDERPTLYRTFFDLYGRGEFPLPCAKWIIVNTWQGGHGEYKDHTQIVSPSGLVVAEHEVPFTAHPDGVHTQIFAFDGITLPEAGNYAVRVHVNGQLMQTYTVKVVSLSMTNRVLVPEGVEEEAVA